MYRRPRVLNRNIWLERERWLLAAAIAQGQIKIEYNQKRW